MSNQMKSFLISANVLILGSVLVFVLNHLYQDHVLVDIIRTNINQSNNNQLNQKRVIPNDVETPKPEEVPKK